MKQFKKPIEEDNKIFPSEYKKDAIIAFKTADGEIYILNEFYDGLNVVAYSLYSNTLWGKGKTIEQLIEDILERGHFVYQFDHQKEFLAWASKV